jgi:hypothetical protein
MRRGFSILLILLFGLGPLQSLIDGSQDANLPACCRRNGAHHCAMSAPGAMRMAAAQSAETGNTPTVSAPLTCPYYPGAIAMQTTPVQALVVAAGTVQAQLTFAYARVATQTPLLTTLARAHAGRGPPAFISI